MAKSILIVDDVPFVRKVLSKILTDAHYQVVGEAADGKQAYEMFVELQPDLITMDVVMPIEDGIEATRKIMKKDNEAKIIIISALGQETMVMEAITAGARDYILKPFTQSDILKAVAHALDLDEGSGSKRSGASAGM